MEVTKPIKVGNVWTNLISGATGESVNYEEVTTWWDGSPMDDSKADGEVYRKLPASVGGGYVRKVLSKNNTLELNVITSTLSTSQQLLINLGHYTQISTEGYYVSGDGGAAYYNIIDSEGITPNSFDLIKITPTKIAKLNIKTSSINAAIGGIVDGYISNITNRLQLIINSSYNRGVREIIIPTGNYISTQVGISNKVGLSLDFGGSTVNYGSLDGRRLFYLEDSEGLTLKNLISTGKMFEGLDRDSVSGLLVDPNADNRKETHRAITAINCNNLTLENIVAEEYYMVLDIRSSRGLNIVEVTGRYLNTGAYLQNISGNFLRCYFADCRFEFSDTFSDYSDTITTAQGSGMIIIPNSNEKVVLTSCVIERCWSNGFRVQGNNGIASFEGCVANQNARHGFSNYGVGTKLSYFDCQVTNLADPEFWTGSLSQNTYRVPRLANYPVGYSFQNITTSIILERCTFESPLYNNQEAPYRTDSINGGIPATIPRSFLDTTVPSGQTQRHKKITIKDCLFTGFTNPSSSSVYINNLDTFGVNIVDNIFETKRGPDPNFSNSENYVVRVIADNHLIKGNSVVGGYTGIRCSPISSLHRYCKIENNYVQGSLDYGIRAGSAAQTYPVIVNNIVKDVPGISYSPDFRCVFKGNIAHNTSNNVYSTVIDMSNISSYPDIVASALNGIDVLGDYTDIINHSGTLTGRQRLISRPSILGNISSPTSKDIIIKEDLDGYIETLPSGSTTDQLIQALKDSGLMAT